MIFLGGFLGAIIVRSFLVEQWHQNWATGKSVVVFDVICALIASILALTARYGERAY